MLKVVVAQQVSCLWKGYNFSKTFPLGQLADAIKMSGKASLYGQGKLLQARNFPVTSLTDCCGVEFVPLVVLWNLHRF